jgi:hypothetical protein
MKIHTSTFCIIASILAVCLWGPGSIPLAGAEAKTNAPSPADAVTPGAGGGGAASSNRPSRQDFQFRVFDPLSGQGSRQVPWLGLATEEVSEVLTSQLRLDPGVGLSVTYIAPDSPAARAGLKKNDVLTEFDGQALVHPAQLRKLVQVRKEGDTVTLTYYRAGKKESASVTLSRTTERPGGSGYGGWEGGLQEFRGFPELLRRQYGETLQQEMDNLKRSLHDLHLDREQVQREVRRGAEEARKAAAEALRHATNDFMKFGPNAKALKDLARGWAGVNKDATVTVNSSDHSVQTVVKTDDTGTCVIVANPRKRLTAHDPAGKLLFDGEIETPEQQKAVPKEIWVKVEPMVDKLGARERLPELESPSDP